MPGRAPTAQHIVTIEPPVVTEVRELARAYGATPFMVLLTVFAAQLRLRSGQAELAIGCPTSGRGDPELSTVVGPFMDALVLRCDLTRVSNFREALLRVRETAIEAYANSDVSFAELVSGVDADPTRHPLFQASVVLQERPSLLAPAYSDELAARIHVGDLRMSSLVEPEPFTTLDVELALFEWEGEYEGVFASRSDVVPDDDLTGWGAEYLSLLDRFLGRPDEPLPEGRLPDDHRPTEALGLPDSPGTEHLGGGGG